MIRAAAAQFIYIIFTFKLFHKFIELQRLLTHYTKGTFKIIILKLLLIFVSLPFNNRLWQLFQLSFAVLLHYRLVHL